MTFCLLFSILNLSHFYMFNVKIFIFNVLSYFLYVKVFITGPLTGDVPEKLEREVKVKVFDNKEFWTQLQTYISKGRLKTPEVRFLT